jgi:type VI secretion system protein ImpL
VRDPRGKVEVIQQDGDWGLLRLFEQGTLVSSTATMFTLSWRVPTLDSEVLIDVKPVRGESPFTPGQGSRKSSFLAVFRGPGLAPLKACE